MNKKIRNKASKIRGIQIIVVILSIYLIFTFVKQQIVMKDLTKQNEIADRELKQLKIGVKDLENKINKSDTIEYIEKISREELKMSKPNELIYKDNAKKKSSQKSD